jgi:hypothetical protein
MKIILTSIAVAVIAVSSSFAQCSGGGCSGSKDGEGKKDAKKESAQTVIVLE